jgi:hypothetical protein
MRGAVAIAVLGIAVSGCIRVSARQDQSPPPSVAAPAVEATDAPRAATPRPVRATPRPVAQPQGARPGVTIWGGTAHLEVARSRSCNDLQSWFDAADAQRDALLDKFGPDDPDYEYAFEVMLQADERMRAIGCYE